ncbi:FapA family protein [Alicyclobacillus mengziensis]|uniref:DUF342 domain-containing protein n=1 Tax=Alicyclobacillus mengziensis TaxID=2931921 RepID=A0A9X7W1K0_9BACL|nr:FapA family protein [Alicyclobacillus mengziensis]QSO48610.1 DUF342 domain-containing protein [Alicyclobacillus mengziensis]
MQVFNTIKQWLFKSRVSISQKLETQPELPMDSEIEVQPVKHGTVSVMENQISITDPDDEGAFATLTIPKDGRLVVVLDGQPAVGRVIVHGKQDIQLVLSHIPSSQKFSSRVSKNAMEVIGRVEVTLGEEYRLKDLHHVRHAVLELEVKPVYPAPLEVDEITAQLTSAGYQGDFDIKELKQLCHANQTSEAIVLRGVPMIPGKPASYRPVKLPKVYDPIHRRMRITTISMGTTVAVLEPEIPGVPGRNVLGQEVPCPKHWSLPELGPGVVEVNGRIVAIRNGRFLYTRSRIDVIPELVISHDLSSKDGKIEFDGNVVVLGSVLDGSFIQATGSVEVHGGVLRSTVMGERGVFVADAIVGSRVVAGQSKFLYMKLYFDMKQCADEFGHFHLEYRELIEHAKKQLNNDERQPLLADVLLVHRHRKLERTLIHFSEDENQLQELDDRYRQIVLELRSKWNGIGRTNISEKDVAHLHQLLADYVSFVESTMSLEPAEVKAATVTSSSVRTSGKMAITGAGVYASSLEARDSILVKGTVRGGFLVAENTVRIHELGTPSGTETSVKVLNTSGRIGIRIRHPNTLLQVGTNRDRNLVEEYNAVVKGERHANSNTSRRRLA